MRIDVALFVDLRDARRTDELSDTVHYGEEAERVAAVVRENMLARLATESPRSSSVEVDRRPREEYRTFRISTCCQLSERRGPGERIMVRDNRYE